MGDIYKVSGKRATLPLKDLHQLLFNATTLAPCEQGVIEQSNLADGNPDEYSAKDFETLPQNLKEKFFGTLKRFPGVFSPDFKVEEKSFEFEFAPALILGALGCGGEVAHIAFPPEKREAQSLKGIVTNFVGPPEGDVKSGNNDDTVSGNGSVARFKYPAGLCMTPDGTTIYVVDHGNYTIRKITGVGTSNISVTTFAGTAGSAAITDGTGAAARFSSPSACVVDPTKPDNMYVTDNNNIRKIVLSKADVTTFVGSPSGAAGYADATGTAARFLFSLTSPNGIIADHRGKNLYVADIGNNSIRQIDIVSGKVTTLIDGLSGPAGLAIDSDDKNLYVTDASNNLVRKVVLVPVGLIARGTVTTLAGSGAATSTDGTGTAAAFISPRGIAIDPTDTNLYVSELSAFANKIRKIVIATGVVTTVAGSGLNDTNGTGMAAAFNSPQLIILDPTGSTLYIPDQYNNKIRQIQ